jgi:hypothetical protein
MLTLQAVTNTQAKIALPRQCRKNTHSSVDIHLVKNQKSKARIVALRMCIEVRYVPMRYACDADDGGITNTPHRDFRCKLEFRNLSYNGWAPLELVKYDMRDGYR